jgi:hypothetical protein
VAGGCFLLAGAFPDDPGLGYPPGTPAQQSLPGLIHGLAITVAFGCLSAACLVMARRFADDPTWRGWARYSTGTGLLVATGYLATTVLTGLNQAGMLNNAPGGLIQTWHDHHRLCLGRPTRRSPPAPAAASRQDMNASGVVPSALAAAQVRRHPS